MTAIVPKGPPYLGQTLVVLTEAAQRVASGYAAFDPYLDAIEALGYRPREDAATLRRLHVEGLGLQVEVNRLATRVAEERRAAREDAEATLQWCKRVRNHLSAALLYGVPGTPEAVTQIRALLRPYSKPRFAAAIAVLQKTSVELEAHAPVLEGHPSGDVARRDTAALRDRLVARQIALAELERQEAAARDVAIAFRVELRALLARMRIAWDMAALRSPEAHLAWPFGDVG